MKTLDELQAMRDEMKAQVGVRRESNYRMRIVVGMATCGIAAGARPVLKACTEEVAKRNLNDVIVSQTGCIGICQFEPVVEIYDAEGKKTTYVHVTPEKVPKIIAQHVVNGSPVVEYTIGANAE